MSVSLQHQTVFITGGANGIGHALAKKSLEAGAHVFVMDIKRPAQALEKVHYFTGDVRESEAAKTVVADILKTTGRVDVLMANAGLNLLASLEKTTPDLLQQIFAVNVFGVYYAAQAVLPVMRQQRYGRILLMGSEQAVVGRALGTAYGMSKAAVVQLAKSLSAECANQGILVNALCPSTVAGTEITDAAITYFAGLKGTSKQEILSKLAAEQLTGKLVALTEVADWAVRLCSPENKSMTGTALMLDGGASHIR